jgi:hypothetical protein
MSSVSVSLIFIPVSTIMSSLSPSIISSLGQHFSSIVYTWL